MCIWIIHSYFKKYPQENPLAVQWLRLQVSNAGVWVGTKIMQPKKKNRNSQHKLSNRNKKNCFNSEKELNPKDTFMLVESANYNDPNTLSTHINVEKIVVC